MIFPVFLLFAIFTSSSLGQLNHKKASLPSPVNYFKLPDEPAFETSSRNGDSKKPEPKFGIQLGYGNELQGYSGNGIVGTYTPLKIDLGGLVLGTVIGLGAVLLAPKILHLFSSHSQHGGGAPYGRSADMLSEIGNTINRIDENLQEMDIDTLSCLQRAACTLVRYVDSPTTQNILNSTGNSLLNFFIEGSKLKNAMNAAMKGEDCTATYSQCSFKNAIFNDNIK